MPKTFSSLLVLVTLLSGTALAGGPNNDELAAVLAEQPDTVKARFEYRHPQQTLEFFGIAPGMTVVEALPGGGWYSKILLGANSPAFSSRNPRVPEMLSDRILTNTYW